MYAELILNDEELAALAERATSLASENQAPDLAQAIDQGCVAAALTVLRKVSHDAQAIAFWAVLGEVPGREAIAHRVAAINALGAVTDRYPLPSFEVDERIPLTFHSTIAALRTEVAERAVAAGRGKELALARYLSLAAITARLNATGGMRGVRADSPRMAKAAQARCLDAYVGAAVVEDRVAEADELREAFALALAGFAPGERSGGHWLVREVAA